MVRDILTRLREAVDLGLPVQLTRQEAAAVAGEIRRLEVLAARPAVPRRGPRSVEGFPAGGALTPPAR